MEKTVQDVVAARAYELWTQSGRPTGRALDHWIQAESELLCKHCSKRQLVTKTAETTVRYGRDNSGLNMLRTLVCDDCFNDRFLLSNYFAK